MIRSVVITLIMLTFFHFELKGQSIRQLASGRETSIRGLSVLNDTTAWVSGSNGWVAFTTNRGSSWTWTQVAGFEKFDFRDIEAFSANEAIIVSAGSPAVVLLTQDAGLSWQVVFRNDSPEIFLDGMDFWNRQEGLIYGDPIDGKLVLLRTSDGGRTWDDLSSQAELKVVPGEASFAASGTNIRCLKDGSSWIATGGLKSRIFYSHDFGRTWEDFDCPIIQGKSSTGVFSLAFKNRSRGIAAGGDYLIDTLTSRNLLLTRNRGRSWTEPKISTYGYRSAVEFVGSRKVLATGTSGTDISRNAGKSWEKLSAEGFHTVRKAKHGSWVLLTGSKGRISEFLQSSE